MSALEIVRTPEERHDSRRNGSSGPSWSSLGLFVAAFFTVLSIGFMVGLAWGLIDTRDELKMLERKFEAQRYVIDELNRQYAVLEDRTKEK